MKYPQMNIANSPLIPVHRQLDLYLYVLLLGNFL